MNIKKLLGEKSTLEMYRDVLKVVPLMQKNKIAQQNVRLHFRMEFEKQRSASEQENMEFRSGIVRLMSNFMAYTIKQQYEENPAKFQNNKTIYDSDDEEEEGVQDAATERTFST